MCKLHRISNFFTRLLGRKRKRRWPHMEGLRPDILVPAEDIMLFFKKITELQIPYVNIKNIAAELPNNLTSGKDIDILVHQGFQKQLEPALLSMGCKRVSHPKGKESGWHFGYQLPPCQMWQFPTHAGALYIDIHFKLACHSLMPKIWIPLDASINESIWADKLWDSENGCWRMDDKNLFVYLIARSIFDKKFFSSEYVLEMEQLMHLLGNHEVKERLERVFFSYTGRILELLSARRYTEIVEDYITFTDY